MGWTEQAFEYIAKILSQELMVEKDARICMHAYRYAMGMMHNSAKDKRR